MDKKTPPWKPPYCRNLYGKRIREDGTPEAKANGPGYGELLNIYSILQTTHRQLMETQAKLAKIEKNMIESLTAVEKQLRSQESMPNMGDLQKDMFNFTKELANTNEKINQVEKTSKEELQAFFEEKVKSAVDTIVSRKPTHPFASTETAETGLFITGLKALGKMLKISKEEDPCVVIHLALKNIEAAAYYIKIVPILSSFSKRRCDAESAIVYFTSAFHRRWISGELRRMLAKRNAKSIGIRDVFEKNLIEES